VDDFVKRPIKKEGGGNRETKSSSKKNSPKAKPKTEVGLRKFGSKIISKERGRGGVELFKRGET